MSITIFGTCRLNGIANNNSLNNLCNYTHSTKEVLQFIRFLNNEIVFPPPYNIVCFRSGICTNKDIKWCEKYHTLFKETDVFLIEICSNKKYIHNNFYLHHLCVDKRVEGFQKHTPEDILNNYVVEKQSDEEIETDILEIRKLLYPKKIIIVSHYNAKHNGEYIEPRNALINLLDNICTTHKIPFVNPTIVLKDFKQEVVMLGDLGHYTGPGLKNFTEYMNNYLKAFN